MKKTSITILVVIALVGILFFISKINNKATTGQKPNKQVSENRTTNTFVNNNNLMSKDKIGAGKIEVVHFHATHQCWSCITVGEYALKTIKDKFPEEYKNGTIIYKDIDVDLPENMSMVIKYHARGSSLFINDIKNGQDNIKEDVYVWRLISDENQFINYFQNKLNSLLKK